MKIGLIGGLHKTESIIQNIWQSKFNTYWMNSVSQSCIIWHYATIPSVKFTIIMWFALENKHGRNPYLSIIVNKWNSTNSWHWISWCWIPTHPWYTPRYCNVCIMNQYDIITQCEVQYLSYQVIAYIRLWVWVCLHSVR